MAHTDEWNGLSDAALAPRLDARDRATWPPELLRHVDEGDRWDVEVGDNLGHYREKVLLALVTERVGDPFVFCRAAVKLLSEDVPFHSLKGRVLDELSSWLFGIVQESVAYALELAPTVLAALPWASGEEMLAALRARLAEEEGES